MIVLDALIYSWILGGVLFAPYILGIAASVITVLLVRKKLANKSNGFKILIYSIIIILCIFIFRNVGYAVIDYLSAKPDKTYTEMKEVNDSQRLIGLSEEKVVALLGKPRKSSRDNLYIYDAGTLTNYFFFGERESYDLFVWFNEDGKVKSTSIDLPLGG